MDPEKACTGCAPTSKISAWAERADTRVTCKHVTDSKSVNTKILGSLLDRHYAQEVHMYVQLWSHRNNALDMGILEAQLLSQADHILL